MSDGTTAMPDDSRCNAHDLAFVQSQTVQGRSDSALPFYPGFVRVYCSNRQFWPVFSFHPSIQVRILPNLTRPPTCVPRAILEQATSAVQCSSCRIRTGAGELWLRKWIIGGNRWMRRERGCTQRQARTEIRNAFGASEGGQSERGKA